MALHQTEIRRVGLDLDNTIIDYSLSYAALAHEFGIDPGRTSRSDIRSLLRGPDNDEEWQRFQSILYTDGLRSARVATDATEFIDDCVSRGIEVYIVSHKTRNGPARFGAKDLRTPALDWLKYWSLVPGLISRDKLHFTDSAVDKVACIRDLDLDIFVDDLPEILDHPEWPSRTLGIRYSNAAEGDSADHRCMNFSALRAWLFA